MRAISPPGRRVLAQLLEAGGEWRRGSCGSAFAGSEKTIASLEERGLVTVAFGKVEILGATFTVLEVVQITDAGRAAFPLEAPSRRAEPDPPPSAR